MTTLSINAENFVKKSSLERNAPMAVRRSYSKFG